MRIRKNIHQYGEDVALAKLDGLAKGLLWLYAFEFEWEGMIPSRLTEREICSMSGMAQSTYYEKRKYLEELGWIKVQHNGFNKPCSVYPLVGEDDAKFESRSWAAWHPLNQTYLKFIRSEQRRMVAEGVDIPFSEVYQLFEDDDELYASFLENDVETYRSNNQSTFKSFIQHASQWNANGVSLYEQVAALTA